MKHKMLTIVLCVWFSSCASRAIVVTIPDNLLYCELATHKPVGLASIATSNDLLKAYRSSANSREKIILQLRECDLKRKALVELLTKEPKHE